MINFYDFWQKLSLDRNFAR